MRVEHWLYTIPLRLRSLFRRSRLDAELNEELRDHIDRQTEDNMTRGMNPEQAERAALRVLGNPISLHEETRATWSWNETEQFIHDLRIGTRTLSRTPGFAVIAILVTALGIGASVALFTVVRGVLLRPLPFTDPDRLLMLYERSTPTAGGVDYPYNSVAGGVYDTWKRGNTTLSSMALVNSDRVDISASNDRLPEALTRANVSWNLFPTLGVKPALGRGFSSLDDSSAANGTVVLSWGFWKRRFGSDPAILNRTIYLNAKPYVVIGVMPEWFQFPDSATQIWTPAYHEIPEQIISSLEAHSFRVVGRLKPGVTATEATANLSIISRRLHDANGNLPFNAAAANSRPLLEHMVGNVKRPLFLMLAATGCLLLIACLNVTNLLVARAASRGKELAIRTALGGGRMRLLRERLMESFLLEAVGGGAGLLLAYWAITWLVHEHHDMVRVASIHLDGMVAAFTVGVVIICALFSGLISAFNTDNKHVLSALHESTRGHSAGSARARLRKILLTLEVGLTVVLLMSASLLVRSYQRLRATNVGCVTDNVLTMRLNLPSAQYKTPGPEPVNFFETLLQRVRTIPGVEAAGIVSAVPGQGYVGDIGFTIAEHPPLAPGSGTSAINRSADTGYFAAMGIPILRGRTFDANQKLDRANEVIVSESFAKQYFPNEDPIGKHLNVMDGNPGDAKQPHEIVGVVGDTRYVIGEAPEPIQYYPLFAGDQKSGTLVIHSSHDVEQFALPVQQIVQSMALACRFQMCSR